MNYYLKYRPQKISELDLTLVRERLGEILKAKTMPHAWLFAGPKGTGKTSAARIIAKAINCSGKKDTLEPCNHCAVCRSITEGTALDILEIDAASNRGIDDIRELRDRIKLSPSSFKYKVYIIDEVHMLTREAFNALLKTLEEPPEFAVFILATTEEDKLPGTIISRCVEVKFTKASETELMRSLKRVVKGEGLKLKDEALAEIAAAADGSFRDAVKFLEHPQKFKPLKLDDWLVLVYRGQTKAALDWLQKSWEEGREPRQLLLAAIERLRRVLLFKLNAGGEDLAGIDDPLQLKKLIERLLLAAAEVKAAAIEVLPLELAVVEWGQVQPVPVPEKPATSAIPSGRKIPVTKVGKEVLEKWPQVLEAVRPLNHSLEALLKATEPAGFEEGYLMIKVYYQFHKDRLEEERYRAMIESVASKVLVMPVKIRFFLTQRSTASANEDIIKTAEEVFGVKAGGD